MQGLENAIAAETKLSDIDGKVGRLVIGGFALQEIALQARYEEIVYLLWYGKLPNKAELTRFTQELAQHRQLSQATLNILQEAANSKLSVIEAIRLGVDSLSLHLNTNNSQQTAITVLAATPSIVAIYWRFLQTLPAIVADPKLGHAANFLYQLKGVRPSESEARALEIYLNTTIEHGLNASTFTARVIASTQSDFLSAIVGAIGALKGPLHGGAPGPALQMVFEIGSADKAEAYLQAKLQAGERLMGFGHRVYKTRDPRANVLAQAAKALYQDGTDQKFYELAMTVEQIALRLLKAHKPERPLYTNVEFYTALLLHGLNINEELFTPIFTISRTGGWLAHCFEQQATGRLMRPSSRYIGETRRDWVGIEQR
jgi:citrate synthase